MSDTVIRADDLGKFYRIGVRPDRPSTRWKSIQTAISSPFKYLQSVIREPSPEETLWALKGVTFEVESGEVLGIVGRNGAGKSTLLKILSRITRPDTGRAEIRGRVGSLLEVGTGFHPELTGRENIYMNGTILGMRKKEVDKKFDEIVNFAEVERFLDTPVKFYSSGMYVRLAFAVAANMEPEILIVDEVLAVGDASFQKKCLGKMDDIGNKDGKTILFVSHSIDTISRLCPKTIVLESGAINFYGNTQEAIQKYLQANCRTKAIQKWEPSFEEKNKSIYFLEARVHTVNGNVQEQFDVTEAIGITFSFRVMIDDLVFTHGCNLFNEEGVNILNSHDIISGMSNKTHSKGDYSVTVWIPSNFLAEGVIDVGLAILTQIPFKIHIHEHNVLTFKVVDRLSGKSARGEYLGNFPGVVRPILKWEAHNASKLN